MARTNLPMEPSNISIFEVVINNHQMEMVGFQLANFPSNDYVGTYVIEQLTGCTFIVSMPWSNFNCIRVLLMNGSLTYNLPFQYVLYCIYYIQGFQYSDRNWPNRSRSRPDLQTMNGVITVMLKINVGIKFCT